MLQMPIQTNQQFLLFLYPQTQPIPIPTNHSFLLPPTTLPSKDTSALLLIVALGQSDEVLELLGLADAEDIPRLEEDADIGKHV